jgi:hypothetical protein
MPELRVPSDLSGARAADRARGARRVIFSRSV